MIPLHTAEINGRNIHNVDPWTIQQAVVEEGVLSFEGVLFGENTTSVIVAYQFNPERFTATEAYAWAAENSPVRVTRFTPADETAVISFAEGEDGKTLVTIDAEVLKDGDWNASTGKFKCTEKIRKAIVRGTKSAWDTVKNFIVRNKLTHSPDQDMAREMFIPESDVPMGHITEVYNKGKSLWVKAEVPLKMSKAIDLKLIFERSVELARQGDTWVLEAVAWLGNTPPAVKGLSDVKLEERSHIAPPRIREIKKLSELGEDDSAKAPKTVTPDKNDEGTGDSGKPDDKPKDKPAGEPEGDENQEQETAVMSEKMREKLVALAQRQIDGYTHRKITVDQAKAEKENIVELSELAKDDPDKLGSLIDKQLDRIEAMADIKPAEGGGAPKGKVNAEGGEGEDGTLSGGEPKEKHALSSATRTILRQDKYASEQNKGETSAERNVPSAILLSEANEILRKETAYLKEKYGTANLGDAITEAADRNPGIGELYKLSIGSGPGAKEYRKDPAAYVEKHDLLAETDYKVEDLQLA